MLYQGIPASFPARDVGAAVEAQATDRGDCTLTPTRAGLLRERFSSSGQQPIREPRLPLG